MQRCTYAHAHRYPYLLYKNTLVRMNSILEEDKLFPVCKNLCVYIYMYIYIYVCMCACVGFVCFVCVYTHRNVMCEYFHLFIYLFFAFEMGFLFVALSVCPGTHSVDQGGFKLTDSSASTS